MFLFHSMNALRMLSALRMCSVVMFLFHSMNALRMLLRLCFCFINFIFLYPIVLWLFNNGFFFILLCVVAFIWHIMSLCLIESYGWLFFFSRFSKCFESVATIFLLHRPNVEDVSIVLFLFHWLYHSTIFLHHLHFLSHIYCAIL